MNTYYVICYEVLQNLFPPPGIKASLKFIRGQAMQPTRDGCRTEQAAAQNRHFPAHRPICVRLAADSAVTSHNLTLLRQASNRLFFGNDCTVIQSFTESTNSHDEIYFCGSQIVDSNQQSENLLSWKPFPFHQAGTAIDLHRDGLTETQRERVKRNQTWLRSIFLNDIDDHY